VGDANGLADIRSISIGGTEFTIGAGGIAALQGATVQTEFGSLAITSVNGGVLSFSYTLERPVDNDSVTGATDLAFREQIPVTVRDATSSASTFVSIEILDDAPVAGLDPANEVLIEENDIGSAGATLQFSLDVSGSGSESGADVPATRSFALSLPSDGVDSGLKTTSGQAVLLYRSGSDTVVGRTAGGSEAFRISVDPLTGIVSVTLLATLAHPADTDVLHLDPGILFATTTITDADGDSDTASEDFSRLAGFGDSEPVITAVQGAALGNQTGLSVVGQISASAADGIAGFDLSPSLGNAPAGLSYALQPDGSLIARDTSGASVFSLSINASGEYTFTALRTEATLSASAPKFSTAMMPAGSPTVSASIGLYGSYDSATGAGIGEQVTSVVFSSANGALNPSNDGLGIGNNLIDNPRTAPAEVLSMQFANALSNASITIGNLNTNETLSWKVYRDGQLVDSGDISRTYVDADGNTAQIARSESPVYLFDLGKNGLDPGVLFDRIEISGGEGTSYKFISVAIEKPVPLQELQLEFGVVATDGDGDTSPVATFTVNMGGADNVVRDTAGDTSLLGREGADVFQWSLAEPGASDTVSGFDTGSPASGGDALDIHDLLPPESVGNLESYLRFEDSGTGGTLLKISHEGAFTGDAAHDAGVSYQSIDLQHVDFSSLGSSQQQIIDNLLGSGKLITE
jgi:hypothetical protein